MWYFTWVLGLGFACAFAVLNAMWLEVTHPETEGVMGEAEQPVGVRSRGRVGR